jgi:hypothetical protein
MIISMDGGVGVVACTVRLVAGVHKWRAGGTEPRCGLEGGGVCGGRGGGGSHER